MKKTQGSENRCKFQPVISTRKGGVQGLISKSGYPKVTYTERGGTKKRLTLIFPCSLDPWDMGESKIVVGGKLTKVLTSDDLGGGHGPKGN